MKSLASVILVLITLPSLSAQNKAKEGERVRLEWKLSEGDVFHVEQTILRKESLETKGKAFKQTSTLTTNFSFTVKEKVTAGTSIVQKIESMKHQGETSDSAGPLAEKMTGGMFTITLTPSGRIAKFEGYDAFLKKVGDGHADFEKTARVLLPEEVLRQTSEELWSFLPLRPVAVGEQWRRETPFSLGPLGSFKGIHVYTFEGPDKTGDVVSSTGTLIYVPPPPGTGTFRISKTLLKAEPAKGRYVFDSKEGRLIQATNTVSFKGHVTIEVTGSQAEMDLATEQTTTIRVLEKEPVTK